MSLEFILGITVALVLGCITFLLRKTRESITVSADKDKIFVQFDKNVLSSAHSKLNTLE